MRRHALAKVKSAHAFLLLSLCTFFSSVQAQECTLPSHIFLPTANEAKNQAYGVVIDVAGDYMVTGVPDNSTTQYLGGIAVIYKLDSNQEWLKIAELKPSNPSKRLAFGERVAIHGNTIAIAAREYNDEGGSRWRIYIFERPIGTEWMSATENYVISKDFPGGFLTNLLGGMDLVDDELVITTLEASGTEGILEIYRRSGGVLALSQSIAIPDDGSHLPAYFWNLALADDFVAIINREFENGGSSTAGAIFVYEEVGGTYVETPVAKMQLPSGNFYFAANEICVTNGSIFAVGSRMSFDEVEANSYVFQKPAGGWMNSDQPVVLPIPGLPLHSIDIEANDDYLFVTGADHREVTGYKKTASGWDPSAVQFIVANGQADSHLFGAQIKLTDEHLVIGCAGRYRFHGKIEEFIIDYFSSTAAWDNASLIAHQKLEDLHHNASGDLFGSAFDAFNDYLAIGAVGDDDKGLDAGVVYIFRAQEQDEHPIQKIYCPDEQNFTGFGHSIAIGDSVLFVGALHVDSLDAEHSERPLQFDIGKVYVYRLTSSGWEYAQQLLAPVVRQNAGFAQTIAWSKGYVAVTEFRTLDSESRGSVHLYKENNKKQFEFIATLTPSTRLRHDFFGKSLVLNDSLIVIGTGNGLVDSGYKMSAYVFRKHGEWQDANEDARLIASDIQPGWSDWFSASVALYGDHIVLGAPYSPRYHPEAYGAAYVYQRPASGWNGVLTEIAKLTASDPVHFDAFGYSVAIDHDDIFVGAPNYISRYTEADKFTNENGKYTPGKVYHFKKPAGGWTTTNQEDRQLESFEPEFLDGYGAKVFVNERYLYVGVMLDDTQAGFSSGSVQTMMQLPAVDALPTVCLDTPPVALRGFPRRGQWQGLGVSMLPPVFLPATAGPGTHTISYTVHGCEASTTINVLDDQMVVLNQSDVLQEKCIDQSVPLVFASNQDPMLYTWYYSAEPDEDFSEIDANTHQVQATQPGIYKVVVTRHICPSASRDFQVIDEAPVQFDFQNIPVVCSDEVFPLEATPSGGTWSGQEISATGLLDPANLEDGDYFAYYEFTTALGCQSRDSVGFKVDKLEQPVIQYNGEPICGDRPALLTLHNIDERSSYSWYDENVNTIENELINTIEISKPGTYSATVVKHSCILHATPIQVDIKRDSVFVPNVFTPNNDAYNQYFRIEAEGVAAFHIDVFNRHGARVFDSDDLTFTWDGGHYPSGVYFWRITYSSCLGINKELKGWVHLVKD